MGFEHRTGSNQARRPSNGPSPNFCSVLSSRPKKTLPPLDNHEQQTPPPSGGPTSARTNNQKTRSKTRQNHFHTPTPTPPRHPPTPTPTRTPTPTLTPPPLQGVLGSPAGPWPHVRHHVFTQVRRRGAAVAAPVRGLLLTEGTQNLATRTLPPLGRQKTLSNWGGSSTDSEEMESWKWRLPLWTSTSRKTPGNIKPQKK